MASASPICCKVAHVATMKMSTDPSALNSGKQLRLVSTASKAVMTHGREYTAAAGKLKGASG